MAVRMLPACRGLASSPGDPFPRRGVAVLTVLGPSDRSHAFRTGVASPEDIRALGVADRVSVCGRGLDCPATHAGAWDLLYGALTMRLEDYSKLQNANFRFAILFFISCA